MTQKQPAVTDLAPDLHARAEASADAVCSRHDRWGWYTANKAALHALQSKEDTSAADAIGRLAQRIVGLAPAAGLYVSIKIEPASPKGEGACGTAGQKAVQP